MNKDTQRILDIVSSYRHFSPKLWAISYNMDGQIKSIHFGGHCAIVDDQFPDMQEMKITRDSHGAHIELSIDCFDKDIDFKALCGSKINEEKTAFEEANS